MSRLGCSLYLDPAKRLREKREAVLLTQMYLVPFPQFIRYITPPPLERYTCGHSRGLIGKKKKKEQRRGPKGHSAKVLPCGNMSLRNWRVPRHTLIHILPRETIFPSNLIKAPWVLFIQLISWESIMGQILLYTLEIQEWANRQTLCSRGFALIIYIK